MSIDLNKIEPWAEKNNLRVQITLGWGPYGDMIKFFVINPDTRRYRHFSTDEMLELLEGKYEFDAIPN